MRVLAQGANGSLCPSRQNGKSQEIIWRRIAAAARACAARKGAGPPALGGWAGPMKGLEKGRRANSEGGSGAKIKNVVSKATKCMKTIGQLTKCHDKKAKIRRKLGLLVGHFRQFDTAFARKCWLQAGITSDYRLRKTLRRAEGSEPTVV